MCRYIQIAAILLLGSWGIDAAHASNSKSPPIRLNAAETVTQVTRGPYLQTLTEDSVIVRWRTDLATDSVVRYGTESANLTSTASESGSRTEHSVTLTGLGDQTQYFYSIGDSIDTFAVTPATIFRPPRFPARPLRHASGFWETRAPPTATPRPYVTPTRPGRPQARPISW